MYYSVLLLFKSFKNTPLNRKIETLTHCSYFVFLHLNCQNNEYWVSALEYYYNISFLHFFVTFTEELNTLQTTRLLHWWEWSQGHSGIFEMISEFVRRCLVFACPAEDRVQTGRLRWEGWRRWHGDGLQELHLFGLQREGKGGILLLPKTASDESTDRAKLFSVIRWKALQMGNWVIPIRCKLLLWSLNVSQGLLFFLQEVCGRAHCPCCQFS